MRRAAGLGGPVAPRVNGSTSAFDRSQGANDILSLELAAFAAKRDGKARFGWPSRGIPSTASLAARLVSSIGHLFQRVGPIRGSVDWARGAYDVLARRRYGARLDAVRGDLSPQSICGGGVDFARGSRGANGSVFRTLERVDELLLTTRRGTRVVTYHGIGGTMRFGFGLIHREPAWQSDLCRWTRNSAP